MYFQVLNDKFCCRIYENGKLVNYYKDISGRTWKYTNLLKDANCEYAYLYTKKSLEESCPEIYKSELANIQNKYRAILTSFKQAKVDTKENCIFDLMPFRFITEYCELQNKITKYIFDNYEKPSNYDYYLDLARLFTEIRSRKISIKKENLDIIEYKNIYDKKFHDRIEYSLFGTKTGRSKITRKSFPILSLNKEYRKIIVPQNDYFVSVDYNAAEVRVLFGLLGLEQPKTDIHEWNQTLLNLESREEAKKAFFAWFYNPNATSEQLSRLFQRKKILDKYYDGEYIYTLDGEKIKTDDYHAFNYLMQNTTTYMVHNQVLKINKKMKNLKSFIAFMVHDNVVFDCDKEEIKIIKELINDFSNTDFGHFPVKVGIGYNYGELRCI